MGQELKGLLGRQGASSTEGKARNPRVYIAGAMGFALFLCFYYVIVLISDFLHHHPIIMMLFPFAFVLMFALTMPLMVFITFIDEFGKLNPLNPKDYIFLAQKTWKALSTNNWKITAKDL